jgi:hypothetical protein
VSQVTELAGGQLNGTAAITIELIEADETGPSNFSGVL